MAFLYYGIHSRSEWRENILAEALKSTLPLGKHLFITQSVVLIEYIGSLVFNKIKSKALLDSDQSCMPHLVTRKWGFISPITLRTFRDFS